MPKRFIFMGIFALIIAVAAWAVAASWQQRQVERLGQAEGEKEAVVAVSQPVSVVASLFPWYDLAKEIGGERVTATLLLPPGVEAHAFEPTPNDMINISRAQLFVYTGDYMEPWAKDLLASLGTETPDSLVIGEGLAVLNSVAEHEHEDEIMAVGNNQLSVEEEHEHEHEGLDPHIWLNPMIMSKAAGRMAQKLAQLDPEGSAYYNARLENYQTRLEVLDEKYRHGLSQCEYQDFIYAGHYAFGYLADRYQLHYEAAQGFSPDAESSPQRLVQLAELLKNQAGEYVFAEELDNPQLAEALAKESGVKILRLNSAHNLSKADLRSGLSYLEIMANNLETLSLGLKCQ